MFNSLLYYSLCQSDHALFKEDSIIVDLGMLELSYRFQTSMRISVTVRYNLEDEAAL